MQKDVLYPAWYLSQNPDVAAAYGAGNLDGAVSHWIDYGMREGRMPNPHFHAPSYLNRYPDLRATFGSDCVVATKHWVANGVREGRDGSPVAADVVCSGDQVVIKTRRGHNFNSYASAGAVSAIPAASLDPSVSDEVFTVRKVGGSAGSAVRSTDQIMITTRTGYYLNSHASVGAVSAIPTASFNPTESDEIFSVVRV